MDLTAQLEQLKSLVSRPLDTSASYPSDSAADPVSEVGHSDAVNVIGNLAFEPSDPLLDQSWRGAPADPSRMQFRPDVAEFVPGRINPDRDPSMNPDAAMFYPHPEADSRYSGWEGKGGSYGGWAGSVDRYGAPVGHAHPSWQKGWPPAGSPGPAPGQWPPSSMPGVGQPSQQGGYPPATGKGGMYHPMYHGQPPPAGGPPPPGYPGQGGYRDGYPPQPARGAPLDHQGPPASSGSSGNRPPHCGGDETDDDRLDAPIWYVLDPKKKSTSGPFSTRMMKLKSDQGELKKMRVRADPDQSWRSVGELFPPSVTAFATLPKRMPGRLGEKAAQPGGTNQLPQPVAASIPVDGKRSVGSVAANGCAQKSRTDLMFAVQEMENGPVSASVACFVKQRDDTSDSWSSAQTIQARAVGPNHKFAESSVLDPELPKKEEPRWEYKDPKGNKQGPFSRAQMRMWHSKGHLPASLLCRMTTAADYRPLAEIIEQNPDPFGENATEAPDGKIVTGFAPVSNVKNPDTSKLSDDAVCVRKHVNGNNIRHFVISLINQQA